MNLQQIRTIREIVHHQLNLSAAAAAMHTSQPGVSRQVKDLETELGATIFVRQGKRLTALTPAGQRVAAIAERLLAEVENLKRVGAEFSDAQKGELVIAATHMQAVYVLPPAIQLFARKYPDVRLSIHQGSPRELGELVITGGADLAVATETLDRFPELVTRPLYRWHHCGVVKKGHALTKEKRLTLKRIAEYPLVTYDAAFTGRSALDETFREAGVDMNVVLTAIDTDVIKTYVRQGLGIGIIAGVAYDPDRDTELVALDASHLFPERVAKLAWRKDAFLRGFVQDFIAILSGELVKRK
jgi:DNA-binding transcriptional LysR family regulator